MSCNANNVKTELDNVNTSLSSKVDSFALSGYATTSSLSSKSNIAAPLFTNYIQTPRIFENIPSSYTSFSSNVLTYDYTNGSILYFAGLTSSTNFQLVLNNMNPNGETYRSFIFTLIINTSTYKYFASTFKLDSTSYTSSSSTPYQVITNVGSYF